MPPVFNPRPTNQIQSSSSLAAGPSTGSSSRRSTHGNRKKLNGSAREHVEGSEQETRAEDDEGEGDINGDVGVIGGLQDGDDTVRKGIAKAIAQSRVTRPIPNSRRPTASVDFVPKQASVPKTAEEKENTRRLIVVLSQVSVPSSPFALAHLRLQRWSPQTKESERLEQRADAGMHQACLETYRVSSGSGGRNAVGKEAKYALLNCDDHQGILAKTGRDIADARPDITHQVSSSLQARTESDFVCGIC